ncbi:MAG TPA: sugar phosphate isomerase/epimerase, partial [Clostridia bacterium]|nr:sugar phosphate isomerase/epimerase [Clostridia bacterium]
MRELPEPFDSPESWIAQLKRLNLAAAYAPVDETASDGQITEYVCAAKENDIVISETNAWGNPMSADETVREAAFRRCVKRLELAEKLGARCCVN